MFLSFSLMHVSVSGKPISVTVTAGFPIRGDHGFRFMKVVFSDSWRFYFTQFETVEFGLR